MSLVGVGACPVGTSRAGLGLVVEASEVRPKLFQKIDGTVGSSELIQDGDFVVDSRAREVGSDSVPMKVLLALTTAKNSSAVRDFGIDLKLDTFRPDAALRVDVAVRAALSDLTTAGLVSIQSITFTKVELTGTVDVKWIDLTTAQLHTSSINV